jgi:hypothetical protein
MVLIFDGEEAGQHNTWGYVHVVDPEDAEPASVAATMPEAEPSSTAPGAVAPSADAATNWPLTLAIGFAGLVLGMALATWAAGRRNG